MRELDRKKIIDIHAHILPGVDDGARDLKESIALAVSAASQGIRAVIATPISPGGAIQMNTDSF